MPKAKQTSATKVSASERGKMGVHAAMMSRQIRAAMLSGEPIKTQSDYPKLSDERFAYAARVVKMGQHHDYGIYICPVNKGIEGYELCIARHDEDVPGDVL